MEAKDKKKQRQMANKEMDAGHAGDGADAGLAEYQRNIEAISLGLHLSVIAMSHGDLHEAWRLLRAANKDLEKELEELTEVMHEEHLKSQLGGI
jgi:hypothetical protein